MTNAPDPRRLGKNGLRQRAAERCSDAMRVCTVPGCCRLPEAAAGQGLSLFICRYHRQHKARHGSLIRSSYKATELKPYRWAAKKLVKSRIDDVWIVQALKGLQGLLDGAGKARRSYDLSRLAAATKARIAFARLRCAEVPPMRLLIACMSVAAAIAEDPLGPGCDRREFRHVQMAKAVHRLASGNNSYDADIGYRSDHYPRSSGSVLRHIGKALERQCEFMFERYLDDIIDLKRSRYGEAEMPIQIQSPRSKLGNAQAPSNRIAALDKPDESSLPKEQVADDDLAFQAELSKRGFQAFAGKF